MPNIHFLPVNISSKDHGSIVKNSDRIQGTGDSWAGIENPLEWLFSSSLASNYQDLHLLLFSYTKAIYRKPR
ncbi:Uricase-2 [Gossypium arboreum]|uniref:Uricase-2 n=1 Tax=Gossypium arboreum TaxID=29729 RepID=A0A0B0NQC7_GOSAR|nr:Uricase-2 [Gossypium arboreum]